MAKLTEAQDDTDDVIEPSRIEGPFDGLADWTVQMAEEGEGWGEGLFPVTLGLRSAAIDGLDERLTAFAAEVNADRSGDAALPAPMLRIPGFYGALAKDGSGPGRGGRAAARTGDAYFTVLANAATLALLREPTKSTSLTHPRNDIFLARPAFALSSETLATETPRARVDLGDATPKPGVAITAIIDVGIPPLNACLRNAAGQSRVQYAWLQGGKARRDTLSFVPFGREYEASDLNDLIDANSVNGPYLDEIAAYREMGLADFSRKTGHVLGRASTHGAHVASLAAGYPMAEDRNDRPVILVELPQRIVGDTSGTSLAPYLLYALDYIADRAQRLAKRMGSGPLPILINFSFGGTGGPLDGTSFLEQRMDAFLAACNGDGPDRAAIVLPSGNARLTKGHARVEVGRDFKGPDGTEALKWRVQPDDQTASFLQIWTPKGPEGKRLEVQLEAPLGGPKLGFLAEDDGDAITWKRGGRTIAKLSYRYHSAPTERGEFLIQIRETAKPGKMSSTAPAGTWTVTLKDTGLGKDAHVDAWILRDEELPGFDTDARQSRFEDPRCDWETPNGLPSPKEPDCPVTRKGLQNVLGTGKSPIVIGGYVDRSGDPAGYSAGGPTNVDTRPGPDALAVSDDSQVHWGVISNGVLSGGRMPADGTSIAVPQVARRLVDVLAGGGEANRDVVHDLAKASEKADFNHRAKQPAQDRGGAGRIQLEPQNSRRYRPFG